MITNVVSVTFYLVWWRGNWQKIVLQKQTYSSLQLRYSMYSQTRIPFCSSWYKVKLWLPLAIESFFLSHTALRRLWLCNSSSERLYCRLRLSPRGHLETLLYCRLRLSLTWALDNVLPCRLRQSSTLTFKDQVYCNTGAVYLPHGHLQTKLYCRFRLSFTWSF